MRLEEFVLLPTGPQWANQGFPPVLPCGHVHGPVTHQSIWRKTKQRSFKIQVASRELRMPLSNVHLRGTSTETVPNANVSGGSVVADLNGLAVKVRSLLCHPDH